MINNQTLFGNPLTTSFQNNNNKPDMQSIYKNLEQLQQTQQLLQSTPNTDIVEKQPKKTVYNDIEDEMSNISEDERSFIINSEAYQNANIEYQTYFNMFLIEHLGNDFLSSKYGRSPEVVLKTIKEQKQLYKNRFNEDISAIKQKNEELTKTNEELKILLNDIKDKVWVK